MKQRSRLIYGGALLLTISLPLLIVSAILYLRFDATLWQHVPFWNDELFHWHQSVSFAAVGFDSGYYTLDENIPIAEFSHFYAWGAWAYVLYGLIGRVTGLPLNAILLMNLAFYLFAVCALLLIVRPTGRVLGGIAVTLATFLPLLLYLSSSLLQLLNLALAIGFVGLFYTVLHRPVGWRFLLFATLYGVLAGLVRPTFALFLAPLYVLAKPQRGFWQVILGGLQALPMVLLAAVGFYTSAAPFPHFRTLLFLGDDPLLSKLEQFARYIRQSIIWLLSDGSTLIMVQRLQIALLLLLLIVWGVWRWRRDRLLANHDVAWRWEWALHVYNLLGFYTATLLFHETLGGHDYRVMSPHLLFSLLLLVLCRRDILVMPLIAISIIAMPSLWHEYQYKAPNFEPTVAQQFADWRSIMGDDLVYQAAAPSAWCNTVTVSAFYVLDAAGQPGMLLALDAGLGISWAFDWVFPDFDLPIPPRYQTPSHFQSRYLILTDDDYAAWGYRLALRRLERAPRGAVYLNEDARCP